jgi:hypothetical protein
VGIDVPGNGDECHGMGWCGEVLMGDGGDGRDENEGNGARNEVGGGEEEEEKEKEKEIRR